jgi:hypothetical protein
MQRTSQLFYRYYRGNTMTKAFALMFNHSEGHCACENKAQAGRLR